MKKRWPTGQIVLLIVASLMTLVASFYFDMIVKAIDDHFEYVTWVKAGILAGSAILLFFFEKGKKPITKYLVILFSISLSTILNEYLVTIHWEYEGLNSFLRVNGRNVLLKLLSAEIITIFLLALFWHPEEVYLTPGNLKVKAEPIRFLGISKNWVSWGKLSWVSGLLISVVPVGLVLLNTIGFRVSWDFDLLLSSLPYIFVMAIFNSLSEGVMCRNAVLGPLGKTFPKEAVMIISGLYFGSFHYYGFPGGPLGVLASSLLGWYMARSMYETKGFLAPWIIHAIQDLFIFMTLAVLGANYV